MFRSYARFGVIVQLMAALLAGIGASGCWRAGTRSRAVAASRLLVLAAGEYVVWPPALSRDVLPTPAHRWVVRQPGRVSALDCAPLTPESASVPWLTGGRIALLDRRVDDCAEPNMADKLSAAGFTPPAGARDSAEGAMVARAGDAEGLHVAARFADADVFAVTPRAPLVYTQQITVFWPREHDDALDVAMDGRRRVLDDRDAERHDRSSRRRRRHDGVPRSPPT